MLFNILKHSLCNSAGITENYVLFVDYLILTPLLLLLLLLFSTTHCSLKAYCGILVRRSNFRQQASLRVSPCESTKQQKVGLWARNIR